MILSLVKLKQKRKKKFRNEYFAVRHGESDANVAGIVCSHPNVAVTKFGLSKKGVKDATEAADFFRKLPPKDLFIFSSPFLRTRETTEVISKIIGTENVAFSNHLRERFFGTLDLQPSEYSYDRVWREDELDGSLDSTFSCESVYEVAIRALQLIHDIESEFENYRIILVSHGDTIQILRRVLNKKDPCFHRYDPHVKPGGVVALT